MKWKYENFVIRLCSKYVNGFNKRINKESIYIDLYLLHRNWIFLCILSLTPETPNIVHIVFLFDLWIFYHLQRNFPDRCENARKQLRTISGILTNQVIYCRLLLRIATHIGISVIVAVKANEGAASLLMNAYFCATQCTVL